MEKAKIRAAAYCRVSTDQELQDLSFESQCNYYRQLIESDPGIFMETTVSRERTLMADRNSRE